jgi:hypothetical protein
MDYATETRMKWLLRSLRLPALFFVLLFFLTSSIAQEDFVFDKAYYRDKGGIFIDTVASPIAVKGQVLRFKWGYDIENVLVPYKFAEMPFWIEHDLPFAVDLCNGKISFKTTYPTSTQIQWDYNVYIPNYRYEARSEKCAEPFDETSCLIETAVKGELELVLCDRLVDNICDYTEAIEDGTYTAITKNHWIALSNLASCPLEPNKRYYLRHYAEIPVGSEIVFDVSLELNLPTADKATFIIPAPSWTSTASEDFNTGTGFDFNWTKVTWDGNIMPVGDDRKHNDLDQAFYDQNLVGYWKFNDKNASGTGIPDDTNRANNVLLVKGIDINGLGMWDTNAINCNPNIGGTYLEGTFAFIMPPLTISAWIKRDADAIGAYGAIASKGGLSASMSNFDFGIRQSSANRNPYLYWTDTANRQFGGQVVISGASFNNKWNHLVGVIYSNYDAEIFLNGTSVYYDNNAGAGNLAPTDGQQKLRICASYLTTTSYYFSGFIDELKIYNRALSAAEIYADYNSWMNSNYNSPIKDAGATVQWDNIQWQQLADVNNNVTVDYRSCDDAACDAESWITGLVNCTASACNLSAANNRYFQYRVNFDTNTQQWNPIRTGDSDKGIFGHFSNATVNYTELGAPTTCDCPASGNWNIADGSVCTLSTTCTLTAGSLNIKNGSLYVTSTGTLSIPIGYKIIIEKTYGKMVVEKQGKVIINK